MRWEGQVQNIRTSLPSVGSEYTCFNTQIQFFVPSVSVNKVPHPASHAEVPPQRLNLASVPHPALAPRVVMLPPRRSGRVTGRRGRPRGSMVTREAGGNILLLTRGHGDMWAKKAVAKVRLGGNTTGHHFHPPPCEMVAHYRVCSNKTKNENTNKDNPIPTH